jgi:tetratricopeptide (TPR) repeat protein
MNLKEQLKEWQEKLDFYRVKEAQIVDLEQRFAANKKIHEAEHKIEQLQKSLENINEDLASSAIDNSPIKTLHQALDIFLQQRDRLDHKTSMEEFEDLEKIRSEIFDKVFGEFTDKIAAIPVLKDKAVISLFERILTSEKIDNSLLTEISNIRKDYKNYQFYHRSIIVSSLTLSVLSWQIFDSKKIDLLIDFLTDFEEEVWNRALTGIIISIIIHQNRLQRFPQLIRRLQTLQELEKVQIGIFLIDYILRNQLYKSVVFPSELKTDDYLNETPYNWFFPFYKDNEILSEALEKTEQDIEADHFVDYIYNAPLIGAYKYVLCHGLKDNKIKIVKHGDDAYSRKRQNSLYLAYRLDPYFNLISEFYLYYRYSPKERVQTLFSTKITLAETKLKNIILSKTQALKLAADLHFEKSEYGSCIEKLKDLLNIEPNQLSGLIQISHCYIMRKEYSEALNYLMQVEKFSENDVENLFDIGFCLSNLKQYKKSNEYLLRANQVSENEEKITSLIGQNYKDLQDYDTAIKFNLETLAKNEQNEEALYNLSICYSKTNKLDEALSCSLKLHQMFPKDTSYIIGLAEDYADLEKFEEAVTFAEKAFLMESESADTVFGYGRILFLTQFFDKAKLTLNKVLSLNNAKDFFGITFGNLGHIYLFEGDEAKSLEYYRKCVLEFDDIKEFQEKFDTDLKYALAQNVTAAKYNALKEDLVAYWQENN